MSIAERLTAVRATIAAACERHGRDPLSVELLAVSKQQGLAAVREALAQGQRRFGENRVQELRTKAETAAEPMLEWHMIGSLQTNKVKDLLAVPGLALLQSLDRRQLADVLQMALCRAQRTLDVLLQVNVSGEASKHGIAPHAAHDLLAHVLASCPGLSPRGIMAMGPLCGDAALAFRAAARLRTELEQRSGRSLPIASMGMSADLDEAIAAGATMVRIGTAIFGARP